MQKTSEIYIYIMYEIHDVWNLWNSALNSETLRFADGHWILDWL